MNIHTVDTDEIFSLALLNTEWHNLNLISVCGILCEHTGAYLEISEGGSL